MAKTDAFPALDGKGKSKKAGAGPSAPPPECGAPLEAGYMVQEPADPCPSSSPSCFIKVDNAKAQDLGKRLGKK